MVQKQMLLFFFTLALYGVFFYCLFIIKVPIDFSSFYYSALAFGEGGNPYSNLLSTHLPNAAYLSTQLNPPFLLLLLQPLTKFSYVHAAMIWWVLSFGMGLLSALLVFKLLVPKAFLKKNWPILFFAYLAFFPTLINMIITQIGNFLLFFLIAGYYCYQKKHDFWAGTLWGIIAAIKLFPALLLIMVFKQKRVVVFSVLCVSCMICWLLPYLHHPLAAGHYFEMLPKVTWYADSWNASLYGMLFRLFFDNLIVINTLYCLGFIGLLTWFFRHIDSEETPGNHRSFCLTLVMMLLLSPLGWMYYFSLLILPLLFLGKNIFSEKLLSAKHYLIGILAFVLLNFPMGYLHLNDMTTINRLGLYSFYFYGLVLLAWLLSCNHFVDLEKELYFTPNWHPIFLSLALSLLTVTWSAALLLI